VLIVVEALGFYSACVKQGRSLELRMHAYIGVLTIRGLARFLCFLFLSRLSFLFLYCKG